MMSGKRDITIYLEDIIESADLIDSYIGEITESEFYKMTQIQDSVLHRIQIIGEAAKHVPETFRKNGQIFPGRKLQL